MPSVRLAPSGPHLPPVRAAITAGFSLLPGRPMERSPAEFSLAPSGSPPPPGGWRSRPGSRFPRPPDGVGLSRLLLRAFRSAPAFRRVTITAGFPLPTAAQWRGVLPFSSSRLRVRPRSQEDGDHGRVLVKPGRPMEWGQAVFFSRLGVRPCLQEGRDHGRVLVIRDRPTEWGHAVLVSRLRVRTCIQKCCDHGRVLVTPGRLMEWGHAVLVSRLRVRTCIQECCDHGRVLVTPGRLMEWGLAAFVSRLRVRTCIQKCCDHGRVLVIRWPPNGEGSLPLLSPRLQVCARLQERRRSRPGSRYSGPPDGEGYCLHLAPSGSHPPPGGRRLRPGSRYSWPPNREGSCRLWLAPSGPHPPPGGPTITAGFSLLKAAQ